MKKVLTVLFSFAILSSFFSCGRECKCIGSHPASDVTEEHSYGEMTTKDCQDKQLRMNTDTMFKSNKIWICEN